MKYTTHEKIADEVTEIVEANLACVFAHNRENLDDIISDLIQYRDTLPTCDEYLAANEL